MSCGAADRRQASDYEPDAPLATSEDMEHFYTHLENVLTAARFLDPDNPRHLMRRLRRLFIRAKPDQNESISCAVSCRRLRKRSRRWLSAELILPRLRRVDARRPERRRGDDALMTATATTPIRRRRTVAGRAALRILRTRPASSPICSTRPRSPDLDLGATESDNLAILGAARYRRTAAGT